MLCTAILVPVFIFHGQVSIAQEDATPLELRFWHPYTDTREAMLLDLIDTFNTEHDDTIRVEARSFQNAGLLYDQLILQLTSTQNLPNLVQVWPHEAALFDLSGRVLDASDIVNTSGATLTWLVEPQQLGQDAVTGKVLGVPLQLHAHMLYINLDALAELGYAAIPQNFTEVATMACDFRAANGWSGGRFGIVSGLHTVADGELLQAIAAGAARPLFDGDSFNTTTPELRHAVDILARMVTDGCLTASETRTDSIDSFASGRSLFYLDTSAALPQVENAVALNFADPFTWGAFAPPGEGVFVSGLVLSIFDNTPEENAAAQTFVRWVLEAEQNAGWVLALGGLPINSASLELLTENGNVERIADAINNRTVATMPTLAGYDVLRLEMQFILQNIFVDNSTIPEQLGTLEANLNALWPPFYGIMPSEGETP